MRKKTVFIVGILLVVVAVGAFFAFNQGDQKSKESSRIEWYKQKEAEVIEESGITEEEMKAMMIDLVSLGRNELGTWRERENSWVVEPPPNYDEYVISDRNYEELLRRIQIFIIAQLHKYLVEKDWSLSAGRKLTRAKTSETFSRLIEGNEGVAEDLFHRS